MAHCEPTRCRIYSGQLCLPRWQFVRCGLVAEIPSRSTAKRPERVLGSSDSSDASAIISFPVRVETLMRLVVRYRDRVTDGWEVILAGLGRNATEAAAQFASSMHYLQLLRSQLKDGFSSRSVEAVLKVNVIDGKTGAPSILAIYFWVERPSPALALVHYWWSHPGWKQPHRIQNGRRLDESGQ